MTVKCTCPECRMTFNAPRSGTSTVTCPICDTSFPVPNAAVQKASPAAARRTVPAPPPRDEESAVVVVEEPPNNRRWIVLSLVAVVGLVWLAGAVALAMYLFHDDKKTVASATAASGPPVPSIVVETLPSGFNPSGPDDGSTDDSWTRKLRLMREKGLDLVICFDSTGSMGGEIMELKTKISRINRTLFKLVPSARISICTYRDIGDEYVVKGLPLTADAKAIEEYLQPIKADGGGDEPEAVQEGLRWSVEKNTFRKDAVKVLLLFGDAPPHDPDIPICVKIAGDFRTKQGGVVSTVTCRGGKMPSFVQIAQAGGGEAFEAKDDKQIVEQLIVLVFGSENRTEVLEAFKLLEP